MSRAARERVGALAAPHGPLMTALAVIVLINYAAQIPYYFILYFPRSPSLSGVGLLAVTLGWFLVGFTRFQRRRRFGAVVLGTFLATEVAFYGALIALSVVTGGRGGATAQLTQPDLRLWAVFAVGYLNFVVAASALAGLLVAGSLSRRTRPRSERRPAVRH